MLIVKHDNNIITNIYSCNKENIHQITLNENECLIFESSDAYTGLDIRALNQDGSLKTLQERFDLGLITLAEDEIFEDGEIKKRPENPENTEENVDSKEKTLAEAISEKNRKISSIKDQYVTADLLEDTELKSVLKTQYLELKNELDILQNNKVSNKLKSKK